jgi:hypothetical protein
VELELFGAPAAPPPVPVLPDGAAVTVPVELPPTEEDVAADEPELGLLPGEAVYIDGANSVSLSLRKLKNKNSFFPKKFGPLTHLRSRRH